MNFASHSQVIGAVFLTAVVLYPSIVIHQANLTITLLTWICVCMLLWFHKYSAVKFLTRPAVRTADRLTSRHEYCLHVCSTGNLTIIAWDGHELYELQIHTYDDWDTQANYIKYWMKPGRFPTKKAYSTYVIKKWLGYSVPQSSIQFSTQCQQLTTHYRIDLSWQNNLRQ